MNQKTQVEAELPLICRLGIHMYYDLYHFGKKICSNCCHTVQYKTDKEMRIERIQEIIASNRST